MLVAACAVGVVGQGGFHKPHLVAVLALLALATWLSWRAGDRPGLAVSGVTIVGGALAVWTVVRAQFAGGPASAAGSVATVAAIMLCVAVVRRTAPDSRLVLLAGLLGVGTVVAASGWLGVALHLEPLALRDPQVWRAASTLTYSNAAAGLLAPLVLVAVGRATMTSGGPARRRYALVITVLLVGLAATFSIGGLLSLFVGLVVLGVLIGWPQLLRAIGVPVAGAVIAMAGLVPSIPVGSSARPVLATAALLGGLALVAWLASVDLPRCPTWFGAVVPVVLVAGGLAVAGLSRGRHFIAASSLDRLEEARAALQMLRSSPWFGVGPGLAGLTWFRDGVGTLTAQYAHNEYLQVGAELGLVGLVLVGAFLLVLFLPVVRTVFSDRADGFAAGAMAAAVAFGLHSSVDFLWHLPVLPVIVAALVVLATSPKGSL